MKDGKDVLFTTAAEKAAFVPQIDVAHQMYNNIWPPQHPEWMSSSYLENKRNNARILREKGLDELPDVRSARHQPLRRRGPARQHAAWRSAEHRRLEGDGPLHRHPRRVGRQGYAPPPTHSDDPSLGGDGAYPALSLPEIACPLGVYYNYPETVSGTTAFAAFTGKGIEPLNSKNVWVDMNRNGVWDYRETPTQAWRRLGLLKPTETLTQDKYVACVQSAADALHKEGFVSDKTVAGYVAAAKTAELAGKDSAKDTGVRKGLTSDR